MLYTNENKSNRWILKKVIFLTFLFLHSALWSQDFLQKLISDTLYIPLKYDSVSLRQFPNLNVIDARNQPGNLIAIRQKNVWNYIPVDQYLVLNHPLGEQFIRCTLFTNPAIAGTLKIHDMKIWYDSAPLFSKRLLLNAWTSFTDDNNNEKEDFLWEIPLKRQKKEKNRDYYGRLMETWIDSQLTALCKHNQPSLKYMQKYRRQLITWTDFILLPKGYIINAHLTLYYPADMNTKFIRSSAGMYYRKSPIHESVAVGGGDQHFYYRLSDAFLSESYLTIRLGMNRFYREKIQHTHYYNLFMLNLSLGSSLQYRPVLKKGIYLGAGFHAGLNLLPDLIDRFEPGILFSMGVILP